MVGWGGNSDCCSHLRMHGPVEAAGDFGAELNREKDSGGGSKGRENEHGHEGGDEIPFRKEGEEKRQELLQEEIEREATLEAINADRGEREGLGEREEWSDPEVQGRFRAARERAAARRRARSQKKTMDAASGGAAGKGYTRRSLLAADGEPESRRAAPESPGGEAEGQLCFVEGALDVGGVTLSVLNMSRDAGACLSARNVVVGMRARCSAHLDCLRQAGPDTMCIHAAPEPPDLFLPLQVLHASSVEAAAGGSSSWRFDSGRGGLKGLKGAEPVLFLGSVQELYEAVATTPYRLRTVLLFDLLARLDLPLVLARLLAYIAAISASIAVFNLVPASGLDGEFTFQALCDMAARRGGVGAMLPMEARAAARADVGGLAWRNCVVRGCGMLLVASLISSLARM